MKFGVREIVDVVFKAASDNQQIGTKTFKKYQPVFMIDTATTSSLEQATTTVYAQGGKGYARLIAWEGEKQMTFTVTDALISPMGLAVLTGAGLIKPKVGESQTHVHTTINVGTDATGVATVTLADLNEEYGLDKESYNVCATIEMFATKLDGSGAGIEWFNKVTIPAASGADYVTVDKDHPVEFLISDTDADVAAKAAGATVQVDFYALMDNGVTEVQIEPDSFGGYFYVEAQTLFRREDTGKDMAAEIIIPKAKVQSAFTFTMAASGDPSTFDFVMDAFPGYTKFDNTKKQMCVFQIIGDDNEGTEEGAHKHNDILDKDQDINDPVSPYPFQQPEPPVTPSLNVKGAKLVTAPDDENKEESQENQDKLTVTNSNNTIAVKVTGGVNSLNTFASTNPSQGSGKWIGLDINTGESDITKVTYNGSLLTADDVAEAASVGLGAGHFILWLKAEVVKATPRKITLGTAGKEDTEITITVADAA